MRLFKGPTVAWSRLRIRPTVLRDVSQRNLSASVLGRRVPIPVGVSPTAFHGLSHHDGECATARGAGAVGAIFVLSVWSTKSIEEVAAAAPDTIKWQHVHLFSDRNITHQLVSRAERAGFQAIVVTVDTPVIAVRHADVHSQFKLPKHLSLANFREEVMSLKDSKDMKGITNRADDIISQSQTWEDIKWLKSITKLPVIAKGIMTPEDAVVAADVGVAGILVSNHGSRQLDSLPASIEVLPEIVKAVGDRCEIYLDGGIRQGVDVFRALALGARMVFVGRPAIWGLAVDGEQGVAKVLNVLKNELDHAFALSGCTSVKDIKPDTVVHESRYSRL
ncbi:uncharacterized protein [Anabrus simplex]|uniref:uncharacterized protein isoform X2 n=1 Tax=Anabrus simplex TaxID=316456 RepID=UPI0035A36545